MFKEIFGGIFDGASFAGAARHCPKQVSGCFSSKSEEMVRDHLGGPRTLKVSKKCTLANDFCSGFPSS